MRLVLAQARRADAQLLGPRLRIADRLEIAAATGRSPEEAIHAGIVTSADPVTILHAGVPVAVFGIVDLGGAVGRPWLLGTDDLLVHWREFARRSREVLATARRPWRRLENHVHAANVVHVRFLRWLGAELGDPVPFGVTRAPFHPFTL